MLFCSTQRFKILLDSPVTLPNSRFDRAENPCQSCHHSSPFTKSVSDLQFIVCYSRATESCERCFDQPDANSVSAGRIIHDELKFF